MCILSEIKNAAPEEINDLLLELVKCYGELFPGWELHILTIEKAVDKNEQIDRMISLLEKMKDR